MPLIDSHAHLDFEDYAADLDGVVARARAAGLERIVCIGLWRAPGSFGNALDLAARDPSFFSATVGIHPHECAKVPEDDWARHEALARDPRVVAIGETGLDYYYDHSPREAQREAFPKFIELARAVGKPVVCHIRDAHDDARAILRETRAAELGCIIHCFTGTPDDARAYAEMDCYVSFSGIVTYKTAQPLRDAFVNERERNRNASAGFQDARQVHGLGEVRLKSRLQSPLAIDLAGVRGQRDGRQRRRVQVECAGVQQFAVAHAAAHVALPGADVQALAEFAVDGQQLQPPGPRCR